MNAIFVGEKRSGKTTLAFDMALRENGGVIVFDPKKEFRDWPATVSSIAELEKAIKDKHRVIIWRPALNEFADDSFDALADWVMEKHALALAKGWDKQGSSFTLLIDEAYNLQSHAWMNQKLMKILSECRPEILNVFQTFQSVKNVNSDSRSRVSDWYLFTITLPTDIKRLEEFAQPEVLQEVQTLDEHQYVHFLNEKGKVASEVVTDADSWYRDLNYVPENESEEKIMPRREEWEPVQFDSEDDFWDFVGKRERRTKNEDSEHKERRTDSGRRERSGERGGNRGSGNRNGKYLVYKKAS
jgi:hypothetical protein